MRVCVAFSNNRRSIALLPLMALLAATSAASNIDGRLELLRQEDARVAAIFLRLARAATPYCRRQGPQTGMVLQDLGQYAVSARPAAARLFGLGDRVAVLAVVPDGAAARAGLAPGDAIVSVDGEVLATAVSSNTSRGGAASEARDRIDLALDGRGAIIGILRAGKQKAIPLVGERACAAHVQVVPDDRFDARADKRMISISTASVELANDDELAFLLAHELGHIARDGSHDEYEADRLGVLITAAAGFDPWAAPSILNRMARARGQGARIDLNHPMQGERLAALRKLIGKQGTSRIPPG